MVKLQHIYTRLVKFKGLLNVHFLIIFNECYIYGESMATTILYCIGQPFGMTSSKFMSREIPKPEVKMVECEQICAWFYMPAQMKFFNQY